MLRHAYLVTDSSGAQLSISMRLSSPFGQFQLMLTARVEGVEALCRKKRGNVGLDGDAPREGGEGLGAYLVSIDSMDSQTEHIHMVVRLVHETDSSYCVCH